MKKGHNVMDVLGSGKRILASLGLACALGGTAQVHAAVQPLDGIAAVVNQDVIMTSDLDQRMRQVKMQLAQRHIPTPPEDALRQQVLERLILEDIQLQLAARAHLNVSDEQLNGAMQDIATRNNTTIEKFVASLEREGYHYKDVREQIRREMLTAMVQQGSVAGQVRVTDQEVDQYLEHMANAQNIEYHLAHILVPLPENPSDAQVEGARARIEKIRRDIADGESFQTAAAGGSADGNAFEGGDLGWRHRADMPSIFANVIPNMTAGDVSAPLRSSSGFHLVKLVDRRGGDIKRYVLKQYNARHILISPNPIRSMQQSLALANSLKNRILAGEDFSTLARNYSNDRGTALSGGELGWVDPNDMVPEFAAVLKTAPVGKLQGPVQSQFGWHLIEVEGQRDHDITVQYEREQARSAIFQRKAEEDLEGWIQELRAGAYVDNRLYPSTDANATAPAQ